MAKKKQKKNVTIENPLPLFEIDFKQVFTEQQLDLIAKCLIEFNKRELTSENMFVINLFSASMLAYISFYTHKTTNRPILIPDTATLTDFGIPELELLVNSLVSVDYEDTRS